MTIKSRIVLICSIVALAFIIGEVVYIYLRVREPVKAMTTEARMRELMGVLEAEQPDGVDPESLRPLLAKYNRLECLEDAWGRAFVIERTAQSKKEQRYRIISLGRDGQRGKCCKKWVESWDEDAVLSGNEWLQVWYPKAARTKQKAP